MNNWKRCFGFAVVVASMCPLMSCTQMEGNPENERFIAFPLPREVNLVGDKCAAYMRTVRPNITANYFLRERDILRDSDILSALVCAVPAATNILISYKGSDKSWVMRHACPKDDRFLRYLDTNPNLYDLLVYISNSLGITPYCLYVDGVWHIFLFDMICGEEREDYIPSSANYLPLELSKL